MRTFMPAICAAIFLGMLNPAAVVTKMTLGSASGRKDFDAEAMMH